LSQYFKVYVAMNEANIGVNYAKIIL